MLVTFSRTGTTRVSPTARTARTALALAACAALALTATTPADAGPADRPDVATAAAPQQVPAATGPDHTSHAFFTAVLKRLKLPVTQANLDALYAVEHREGDSDRYNPLNVVQPEPGSTSYNSVGVQRYVSFETGVDGTVHLMRNGHWTGVRAALRHGGPTSRVLSAFSAAYTWDSGITFQTDRAMLDAEAVRDVGGRYADAALAARRAAVQQGGLKRATAPLFATFDGARRASAAAHSDYAVQQAALAMLVKTASAQGRVVRALDAAARADHGRVVATVTSAYINGGSAAGTTGRLLTSRSAVDYLDTQALQGYVTAGQQWLFRRYLAEERRTSVAAKQLAVANARVATARATMRADQRAWTAADARSAGARTKLIALLGPAQKNSITQPIAAAGLAHLRGH